jgi:signal transduction histidine kinase
MFELPVNDSGIAENSSPVINNEKVTMNQLNNNMISCPTLLTGMSHEMRTYMNAIVAFSFLMKENCSNDSEREDFSNQILNSCEQLMGLFDSFLDSAIIDTGNLHTEERICKVDTLFDDLFSEFREIINKEGQDNLELITDVRFTDSADIFIEF